MLAADSRALLARWRDHADQDAASELTARYLGRLIEMARAQLSSCLRARLDPEDIAQSALATFFDRIGDGRLCLHEGVPLWSLLARIVRRKLGHAVEKHVLAECRTVTGEEHFGTADSLHALAPHASDREPTPDEAAAMCEELERFLQSLDREPDYRRVAELWLQGATLKNTMAELGKGERWVSRARAKITAALNRRMD